jgi:hypothetical protein
VTFTAAGTICSRNWGLARSFAETSVSAAR